MPGLMDLLAGRRQAAAPRARSFKSYVQVANGDAAYDTAAEVIALITGTAHADFRKIWQLTVPAQQMLRWGHGSAALPHNQGYMYFACLDINVDWDVGILRLVQANARETKVLVVGEYPDSRLHSTTVTTLATSELLDQNSMIALPEKIDYPLVGEDSRLQLWYALTVAATAHEALGFKLPVTIYQ